jgi:hypothetical protein
MFIKDIIEELRHYQNMNITFTLQVHVPQQDIKRIFKHPYDNFNMGLNVDSFNEQDNKLYVYLTMKKNKINTNELLHILQKYDQNLELQFMMDIGNYSDFSIKYGFKIGKYEIESQTYDVSYGENEFSLYLKLDHEYILN